jgi:hypothetical protein
MMLMIHSSLALGLIALVFGASFLLYVKSHEKAKNGWTLFVGYFVIIVSFISILCTLYFGLMKPSKMMGHPYFHYQKEMQAEKK